MRSSMITGLYPHQTGIQNNSDRKLKPSRVVSMGRIFTDAGYDTGYFGKWHIPIKKKDQTAHGFEAFEEKSARADTTDVARFIRQKHTRPFLAFASFLGPHEICEWARKEKIPGKPLGPVPPLNQRPPIRANSAPPKNETDIMTHMRKSYQAARWFPVGDYTEADWRRHIWGYYRLIERVDGLVGKVLKALADSGQDDNTVVVFLSDHGDCHGAHRWNQKTVFYDESVRVPFIIRWKGKTTGATSDALANVGVDLIPTICDFAGIDAPAGLPGKSLKSVALGKAGQWSRDYVVSQNHMVQCSPVDGVHVKPHGRMVRSDRYKYCLYSEGKRRESLVDMKAAPGEMVNQAGNPEFKEALAQHRGYLKAFAKAHGDHRALEMLRQCTPQG